MVYECKNSIVFKVFKEAKGT
ncbi:hypothetical protein PITCH_A80003 [uncultured Desulfobacterium sp.]|uniref:Uncharacterized protein n=1 Tax=uncultured Desulfobacterium sp. TaxID=201089 RepID=A0A445N2T3_9BACT|nr:hypothetical protein PITCH_A1540004 [uncultured Desulfobacterium sp.]SPD76008.1 hypothetical protein PITCH_A80003 [uncultured Desulfobacterium sp.]